MNNLPMLGSKLLKFLPEKIWRFLPIYDPYVDYMLSRDLDSPMTKRETEILNLGLGNDQTNNFFYIARDHKERSVPILGGLWGAAPVRARSLLHEIFQVMLNPDIVYKYDRARDQDFLYDFVWLKVQNRSLIFDSAYCETFGGQSFPFQRSDNYCFLGCYRPCCTPAGIDKSKIHASICPKACRPKEHQDWQYC